MTAPAKLTRSSARRSTVTPVVTLERREPLINPQADAYLASLYGPDWERVLDYGAQPHAEHDDDGSAFFACVGTEPFDAAPDLTAHNRVTYGMGGGL